MSSPRRRASTMMIWASKPVLPVAACSSGAWARAGVAMVSAATLAPIK